MHVVLESERMTLRRFTEDDVDDLVELDSDPEVMRFLTGGVPTPRAKIENELLPRILDEYTHPPGWGRWAAIEKATGAFLGWLSLDPPKHGNAGGLELGYRLRRPVWGNGYATEGSRALVDLAFGAYDVQRVFAETMAVNAPSRRVLEKAGLHWVRTFYPTWDDPIEGSELGEVEYELLRAEREPASRSVTSPRPSAAGP